MAKDDNAAILAKIAKLVVVQRELQAKTYEVTEEIQKLLKGDPGIAARLKQVEIAWQTVWSSRYHSDYIFAYVRDRPAIKRLLKSFSPEELQARMLRYIQNDERFYIERRHPFGIFVSTVNQHAAPGPDSFLLEQEGVSGCKHTPPCRSASVHTRRHREEIMR